MPKEKKREAKNENGGNHILRHRDSIAGRGDKFDERVMHEEEFGEENVELVDSDWADFEKVLRYANFILCCILRYILY